MDLLAMGFLGAQKDDKGLENLYLWDVKTE